MSDLTGPLPGAIMRKLTDAHMVVLRDALPTLRRIAAGWVRAPSAGATHKAFLVRDLLDMGYLVMGGPGWCKLTPSGRLAIGATP